MGDKSAIEWTDATWPVVAGCKRVSAGCANCYAVRDSWRLAANPHPTVSAAYAGTVERQPNGMLDWTGLVRPLPDRLAWPIRWKKPRRIFVCNEADLFHPDVPTEFIAAVFGAMVLSQRHTFQVLTKRPEAMRHFFSVMSAQECAETFCDLWGADDPALLDRPAIGYRWPLRNIWLMTSVENQPAADERIPELLATPAVVRGLSCEPLLGPVDIWSVIERFELAGGEFPNWNRDNPFYLHWVIAGGESAGPPERRLVAHLGNRMTGEIWTPTPEGLRWVRSLRDQCQAAGVAFLFKQFGGPTPKSGGRTLDGRTWDQYPDGKGGILDAV